MSKWTPIAWRWNDRPGSWREYDDAPITLDQVRLLCGLHSNVEARPGHTCAHQVCGNKTVLVYRAKP